MATSVNRESDAAQLPGGVPPLFMVLLCDRQSSEHHLLVFVCRMKYFIPRHQIHPSLVYNATRHGNAARAGSLETSAVHCAPRRDCVAQRPGEQTDQDLELLFGLSHVRKIRYRTNS